MAGSMITYSYNVISLNWFKEKLTFEPCWTPYLLGEAYGKTGLDVPDIPQTHAGDQKSHQELRHSVGNSEMAAEAKKPLMFLEAR